MAALRREGRRFAAPLISPQPITAIRSSLIAEYDILFFSLTSLLHFSTLSLCFFGCPLYGWWKIGGLFFFIFFTILGKCDVFTSIVSLWWNAAMLLYFQFDMCLPTSFYPRVYNEEIVIFGLNIFIFLLKLNCWELTIWGKIGWNES